MGRKSKKSGEVEIDAQEVERGLNPSETSPDDQTEDASTEQAELPEQYSDCGELLSAARAEQGLSIKDVAKQLRLSSTQIEALEQDDFASLPEATIVKGFIRNYAKLLKIPAEPLVDAYVQRRPKSEHYSFTLNPGINMKITENGKSHKGRYFFIAFSLFLGVGIWFFYQNYVQKPNIVNPMPEMLEALPELALPMSERIEDTSITELNLPEQAETPTGEQVVAVTDGVVAEGEKSETVEPLAPSAAASVENEVSTEKEAELEAIVADSPVALGKTRLEFTATQETWLSVINTSGREVYNKILYAGGRDVVDVRSPSEIVVGNAHGATLVMDGKSIDLAPYTRINVARVRINR